MYYWFAKLDRKTRSVFLSCKQKLLSKNYQKIMRTAGELHLTICAEWAEDNFGVNFDVNRIDPFSRTYVRFSICKFLYVII